MARLSLEEWNLLTEEEKELREDEMPEELFNEKNKDVIIVDGVARPRKDFEAEILRKGSPKIKEDILKELNAQKPPAPGQQNHQDILATINTSIETEMGKGVKFPTETLLKLINRGVASYITNVKDVDKKASRTIKQIKRALRKKYEDFATYEDEFDDAIDEVHPTRVTEESLNLLFDAIRGRHVDQITKDAEARGRQIGSTKIIGASESAGGSGAKGKSKLTPEQAKEAQEMELEEGAYLKRLEKRKKHAKELGCTIMPQTMGEALRHPIKV